MRGRFANWDRWLTEEERPGFSEVEAIADFTHVPVGYLFLSEPPQEELPIPDFRAGRGPDVAPSGDLLETIYLNQRKELNYGIEVRLRMGPLMRRGLISSSPSKPSAAWLFSTLLSRITLIAHWT